MRNIIGQAVMGDDLFGRGYELGRLWEFLENGEHILMLAPRRVGKTSLMLELHRAPRNGWDVIKVDVEGGDGPEDCVAAMQAELAADPRYRTGLDAIPLSGAIKRVLQGLSANVDIGVLRIELKRAIGTDWHHAARTGDPPDEPAGYRRQAADHHGRAADPDLANAEDR